MTTHPELHGWIKCGTCRYSLKKDCKETCPCQQKVKDNSDSSKLSKITQTYEKKKV
jgi:hypothetical protein